MAFVVFSHTNIEWRRTMSLLLLFFFFISGCTNAPDIDAIAPVTENTNSPFLSKPPKQITPYKLHTGDQLSITVYQRSDFSPILNLNTVTVGPDGQIAIPMIGELFASRLELNELRTELEKRLASYFVSPFIHVSLINATGNKVYILGDVIQPGSYSITWETAAIDAILLAGGFTDTADMSTVVLVRPEQKDTSSQSVSPKAVKMNIEELLTKADIRQNVILQPGDILYIPSTSMASSARFHAHVANILSPYMSVLTTIGNLVLINKALGTSD